MLEAFGNVEGVVSRTSDTSQPEGYSVYGPEGYQFRQHISGWFGDYPEELHVVQRDLKRYAQNYPFGAVSLRTGLCSRVKNLEDL